MTPSVIPNGMRLTPTSQYLSLNLAVLAFKLIAVLDLVGAIALGFFDYSFLSAYLVLCGAIVLFADRQRRRRRYLVAPFFRPVRGLGISQRLLYANWHNFRIINALFVLPIAYYFRDVDGYLKWFALIGLFSTMAMPAPAAALSLIKYHYDAHFRIVAFRRNSADIALAHKSIIMPACGLFGQVLLIFDESLSAFRERSRDRLSFWWLSEMYHPMVLSNEQDHWKKVVMIELTYADFVVLDWSGEITDNMRWELQQALRACPPHRILLIVSSVEDLDKPENIAVRDAARGLLMAPSPQDPLTRLLFLRTLGSAMAALRVEPRNECMLARAKCLGDSTSLDVIDWRSFEECSLADSDHADFQRAS